MFTGILMFSLMDIRVSGVRSPEYLYSLACVICFPSSLTEKLNTQCLSEDPGVLNSSEAFHSPDWGFTKDEPVVESLPIKLQLTTARNNRIIHVTNTRRLLPFIFSSSTDGRGIPLGNDFHSPIKKTASQEVVGEIGQAHAISLRTYRFVMFFAVVLNADGPPI
jgi:hypothetical protein